MARQFAQPPELQYASAPSFQNGLTAAEQAELDQLEAEFAQPKQQGLSIGEENELAQLEAEFGTQPVAAPVNDFKARMQNDFNQRKQQQVGNAEKGLQDRLMGKTAQRFEKGFTPLQVGVGIAGDVAGEGYDYIGEQIPEFVKEPLRAAGQFIAESPVGDALSYVGGKVNQVAEAYPETADYFGSISKAVGVAPLTGITKDVVVGGAKMAAPTAMAIAKAPVKGVALRSKGFKAANGDDLKDIVRGEGAKTSAAYKEVDKTGTVVGSDSANNFLSKVTEKLNETDLDVEFQPKTIAALRVLKNNIDSDVGGVGQVSLGKLDQFRRLLGRATTPEDKLVAAQLRDVLDNHLNKIKQVDLVGGNKDSIAALNKARATAAKGFAVEKIANMIQKADGDDNAIRKAFTKFVNDDKNLRGMSDVEKAAFKTASKNTGAQSIEKFIGRFGIDGKGGVLPTLAAGTTAGAGVVAIPSAAPLVVLGSGAKYTRKLAARGDAQNALEAVLNRSLEPKAKPTKQSLQKAFEAKKGNKKQ